MKQKASVHIPEATPGQTCNSSSVAQPIILFGRASQLHHQSLTSWVRLFLPFIF